MAAAAFAVCGCVGGQLWARRKGCHVALVMGFARGRRPRRNRSLLLDSQQPDECHTPRFARPDSSRSRAGSGAACSSAGRAGNRALASPRAGSSDYAGGCGSTGARSLSDPAARSLSGARGRTASRRAACSPAALRNPLDSAGRSAPAAARARSGGVGSPGRICAQEPRAAGRDLGLFRGGLRAAISAARRWLGLSPAGGQVRPGRDRRVDEEDPSAFCLPPPAGSRARLKRKVGSR